MGLSILLLLSMSLLGLRHGFDWDHIAAITDIVGTTDSSKRDGTAIALSSMYALGHAVMIAILGGAALYLAASLPSWIDPLMEQIVGCTLLFLGVWVGISLLRHFNGVEKFKPQSRWMLLLAIFDKTKKKLMSRVTKQTVATASPRSGQYGAKTAFGIGMLHGIGAETGTQVLLLTSVGGATSKLPAALLLIFFIIGLLVSNTLVAISASIGFACSRNIQAIYIFIGILTCLFSITIGMYFILGQAEHLPALM